jgi:hypothetical protein
MPEGFGKSLPMDRIAESACTPWGIIGYKSDIALLLVFFRWQSKAFFSLDRKIDGQ